MMSMWSVGSKNVIKNSRIVNFKKIDARMLETIIAGSVIKMWRLAFAEIIVLAETG